MRRIYSILLIISVLLSFILEACSDNTQSAETPVLLYSKPGLVDSLIGTCSTYLIRNFIIDTLDFSGYKNASVSMNSFADGDLSEISIYYLNSDTAVSVFSVSGISGINTQGERDFNVPNDRKKYYLRMKLYSSVCTGQLFTLRIRDLNIYGKK
ncbi:MAG: hypothetical protein LWX07_05235 [Bacteroidetes bacterium]|nr:hypothetical protein [Bacteroidota bacterium]